MSQKRSGNISLSQKELMVEFIENNEKMKSGKFTNDFTFKTAQKLWEKLASILNAVPGARKDWRQWRKVSLFLFLFASSLFSILDLA